MGVPGLIRYISENYIKSFTSYLTQPDFFFVDFNGIIYNLIPYTQEQVGHNFSNDKFEKQLIQNVIEHMEYLINRLIRPKKLVYIAFDGVPPFAKVQQQRERRFKGMYKMELTKEKFPTKETWNTNAISPGTAFMMKLQKQLLKALKSSIIKDRILIYDDSNVVGEGEHKFLRTFEVLKKANSQDAKYVIYSPDADLILLSLPHLQHDIYILRKISEARALQEHFNENFEFVYLHMRTFAEQLFSNYNLPLSNIERVGMDLLFLSSFEGNDFVRPIEFIHSQEDTLKTIFLLYSQVLSNQHKFLLTNNEINYLFLKEFLQKLANSEEEKLLNKQQSLAYKIETFKPQQHNNKTNNKLKNFNELIEHSFFYNPENPFYNEYMKYYKSRKLNYDTEDWKKQYYTHYFGKKYDIKTICEEWLKSVHLTYFYYNGSLNDWSYAYPFEFAPLPSDLLKFYDYKPKFNKSKVLSPFTQLLAILPYESAKTLLPKSITNNLTATQKSKLYPENIKIDFRMGQKMIHCGIIIPTLSYEEIKKMFPSKVKLTKEEQKRNTNNKYPIIIRPTNRSSLNRIKALSNRTIMAPIVRNNEL